MLSSFSFSRLLDVSLLMLLGLLLPIGAFNAYAQQQFTLTVNKAGTGTGTVTSKPSGINCGTVCSVPLSQGTVSSLTAKPAKGSVFAGWSGVCSGTGTCTATVNSNMSVTATFKIPQKFTLAVSKAGNGTGTVTSKPSGIKCGTTCTASLLESTSVTLTPKAAKGSVFIGWLGACSGTGSCVIPMNANKSATAFFDNPLVPLTVSVTKDGTGGGTVSSSPGGISCGPTCTAPFSNIPQVTLTAAPASGSTFAGWTGTGCTTGTVTMDTAKSCTATFNLQTFGLTVVKAGTGSGTVTSNPAGINCGNTCSATYNSGTVVTLTATPSGTSGFTGWSGACSGSGSCTLTLIQSQLVSAAFESLPVFKGILSNPMTVVGGQATVVTITATLFNNLPFIKSSVTLWLFDDAGNALANLGQMFDDGTNGDAVSADNIYTKQITLNEIGPKYVIFRVSADVAPQQTMLSGNMLIPVSGNQAPEETRNSLAANIRSGNLSAAYEKLGSTFNTAQILDNVPLDVLSSLADAVSMCNVVYQSELVQLCVGSIVINGQTQELEFFLVRDVVGDWRIIGW